MRLDLQGLEITKGEIRHLSGVNPRSVFRPPTLKKFASEIAKTLTVTSLLALSCWLLVQVFRQDMLLIVAVHLASAIGLVFQDIRKIIFSRKCRNLINLLAEVERYNSVIKAIDINDQIESAGNPAVQIQDREKVIAALKLTREDLTRALKTERILRANENFIKLNPQLFADNLNAIAALQVSDRASERGRLLNEALKIALDVQAEMRQLQDGNS